MTDFTNRGVTKVINLYYKPEFLTACMENLAMIGQLQGYYDKEMEKNIFEYYISPANIDHRKQRGRTAPNRDLSISLIQRRLFTSEAKAGAA